MIYDDRGFTAILGKQARLPQDGVHSRMDTGIFCLDFVTYCRSSNKVLDADDFVGLFVLE